MSRLLKTFGPLLGNVQIDIDNPWPWVSTVSGEMSCYVAGRLRIEGKAYGAKEAAIALASYLDRTEPTCRISVLRKLVSVQSENWGLVVKIGSWFFIAVDHVRSFPLFYAIKSGHVYISNSGLRLRTDVEACRDSWGEREMRMCGFVTGCRTLYEGVYQLEAGQILFMDLSGVVQGDRHFDYFPDKLFEGDDNAALAALDDVHSRVFDRLVESLDGRTVVIPLSAGKDSRLILGSLIDRGYKDIWCYSHGPAEHIEVRWVAELARQKKLDWRHVAYDREFTGFAMRSKDWREYTLWASQGASVPIGVDYFSILHLQMLKQLPDSPVFVNGQSGDFLNGDQVPKEILGQDSCNLEFRDWLRIAVNKHYGLWPRELHENYEEIASLLRMTFSQYVKFPVNEQEAVWCWDRLNWSERQSKYIVNGQRMYEWFGHPWLLPLWDRELVEFWCRIPLAMKKRQSLLVRWLETRDPGGLFNTGIPLGKAQIPTLLFVVNALYYKMAELIGWDPNLFKRTVLVWFGDYRLYYPQRSFFEFLKDSAYHRNSVSYVAKRALNILP